MISGLETMTCTGNPACVMKSVTFSLMVLLNVVQSYFFKCTICMDYAMDIMVFFLIFMLLPGKSESTYLSHKIIMRKRHSLTLDPTTVHTDYE